MNLEISGSVPRFTRREMSAFVRSVLLTLEKLDRLDYEISDVSLAFVDDDAMKALNQRFRRKNRTTDVLTFPADDSYGDPAMSGRPLGDIVISVDQARRQAADEKHSLPTEVRYLILHGILHALGYNHEADKGEMNTLELELRRAVRLE
ncbi:MAG: rRNA maturation RNase YbeY [Acidobacteriota bacterium]